MSMNRNDKSQREPSEKTVDSGDHFEATAVSSACNQVQTLTSNWRSNGSIWRYHKRQLKLSEDVSDYRTSIYMCQILM